MKRFAAAPVVFLDGGGREEISEVGASGRDVTTEKRDLKKWDKRQVLTVKIKAGGAPVFGVCVPYDQQGRHYGRTVQTGFEFWTTVTFSMPGVKPWQREFIWHTGHLPPFEPNLGCDVDPREPKTGDEHLLFHVMYCQLGSHAR